MKSTITHIFSSPLKKLAVMCACLAFAGTGYSFSLNNFTDPAGKYPLIIIPDSIEQNLDSMYVGVSVISISPGYGYTTLTGGNVSLTDTTYFQYLGELVLDTTDSINSARYVYRFIDTGYSEISGTITYFQLRLAYTSNNETYEVYGTIEDPCYPYNPCPDRYMMLTAYTYWFNNPPLEYPGYGGAFGSMTAYQQQMAATFLNWDILNSSPTVSDYQNILNPVQEMSAAAPTSFCTDSSETHSCNCLRVMQDTIQSIDAMLTALGGYDSTALGPLQDSLNWQMFFECFCASDYYIFMNGSDSLNAYDYLLVPAKAWLPTIEGVVVFSTDTVYKAAGYSYNATQWGGIGYTGSGHFTYSNGFKAFNYTNDTTTVSITANGPTTFCSPPDSVVLTLTPTDSNNIEWNNGDTTVSISAHSSGSYWATYIDSSACILHSDTIAVTAYPGFQLADSNDAFYCIFGDLGTINLSVTGGTAPLSILWSNSDTTQNIQNLASGIYKVTVSDAHGCMDSLADSLSCIPYCGIDSLHELCYKLLPVPQFGAIVGIWTFSFDWAGAANSQIVSYTTLHTIPLGGVIQGGVNPGFNGDMQIAAILIGEPYEYDTVTIFIVDAISGDTCSAPLVITIGNDSAYYFPACTTGQFTISSSQVYCEGLDTTTGLPMYMLTDSVTNPYSSQAVCPALFCFDCNNGNFAETNSGTYSPGTYPDTLYFEPATANQDTISFIYVTTDGISFTDTFACFVCKIVSTVPLTPCIRPKPEFGQDLVAKLIGFTDEFTACQTDTFKLSVLNNTFGNETFAVEIQTTPAIAATFQLLSGSGTVSINGDTDFISETLPGPDTVPDTLIYTLTVPCSEIPLSGHVNLSQIISFAADSLGGPFAGTYRIDSVLNPDTLQFNFSYPLLDEGIGYGIPIPLGGDSNAVVTIRNNGGSAYNGPLVLNGGFNCDTNILQIVYMVVKVNDTTVDSILNPIYPDTISNLYVPVSGVVTITQRLHLVNCTSGCTENFFTFFGCPGNLCDSTNVSQFSVGAAHDTPCVIVSRITPRASSFDQNQFAWDGSCVNTETEWEFLVINLGSAEAKDVSVNLAMDNYPFVHYTYIRQGTLQIDTGDTRFPAEPAPAIDTSSIVLLTDTDFNGRTACFSRLADTAGLVPIKSFYMHLPDMEPGQNFVIKFNTWRCCANDNPFDSAIDFNHWQLLVSYEHCGSIYPVDIAVPDTAWLDTTFHNGGVTTPTYYAFNPDNPVTGYISSNAFSPNYADLQLSQTYEEAITDLTGAGSSGCGTPQMFSITNRIFQGKSPSDYGTQLFCDTDAFGGLSDITGANPEGQFKVEFHTTSSIQFANSNTPYIVAGAIKWLPSLIDTSGVPYAIFDIANGPYYDTSGALITGPIATSYEFRNFFVGSNINFWLRACCPAPSHASIVVNTLFNPEIAGKSCDTCFIPLFQIPINLQLLCPGCVTPGVITYNFQMVRTNFGYTDLDDNGLPDGTALTKIDSSYEAFSLLTRNGSIVGDTLMSIASSFFEDGDSADGFSYAEWQRYWATADGGDTPRITHLYFEEEDSNANAVGLKCIGAKVLYKCVDSTNTITYVLPSISSATPLYPDSIGRMLFDILIDSLPGHVVVEPRDSFTIIGQYIVCNNPNSTITIGINTEVYMSDATLPTAFPYSNGDSVVGDLYQYYDSLYGVSDSGQNLGPVGYHPTDPAIFICQAYSGVHYVFPIVSSYLEVWDDNPPSCGKSARITASYYINGPNVDIFPYEYRPMPGINPYNGLGPMLADGSPMKFHFTLPQGYAAFMDSSYTEIIDYCLHIQNKEVNTVIDSSGIDTSATLIGPYTFDYYIDTAKTSYSPPFAYLGFDTTPVETYILQQVTSGSGKRLLFLGDEFFSQGMLFHIAPICSTAIYPRDTIRPSDAYAVVPQFNGACIALTDDTLDNTIGFPYYLTIPDPHIDTQVTSIFLDSSYAYCYFNMHLTTGIISNLFYYIDIDLNSLPNGVTVVNLSDSLLTYLYPSQTIVSASGTDTFTRFSIGALDTSETSFRLKLLITNCDSIGKTLHIKLYYFWSCDEDITKLPVDSGTLCAQPDSIVFPVPMPSVTVSDSQKLSPGPYSTCTLIRDTFIIVSRNDGGIGNLVGSIVLPQHVRIDTAISRLDFGGGNDIRGVHAQTDTTGGDTLWTFNLHAQTAFIDTPPATIDGLKDRDEITLILSLVADCHIDSLPELTFKFDGNFYCGLTFDEAVLDTALNFAPTVYTIPAIALTNGCGPHVRASETDSPCYSSITFTTSLGSFGNPPLDTVWSPSSPDFSNPDTGLYVVTVTDANGCVGIDSVHVNDTLHISNTVVNAECLSSSNGSITISVSGGVAPYTFLWNGGDTAQSRTGLSSGTYHVTATDVNHCTATANITVGVEESSSLTIAFVDSQPGCKAIYGDVLTTVTGGTPGYHYMWNTGATTANLLNVDTGNEYFSGDTFVEFRADTEYYTLTVTDTFGCTKTADDTLYPYNAVFAVFTQNSNPCVDTGEAIRVAVVNGTPPYHFLWSNGDTTENISGLGVGAYRLTITDAKGCIGGTGGDSLFVYQDTMRLRFTNSFTCSPDSPRTITVTVSGNEPPFAFSTPWSQVTDTTASRSISSGGIYNITVTDSLSCTITKNDTLAAVVGLNIVDTMAQPTCYGYSNGSIKAGASGGTAPYKFQWSNGDTTRIITGLAAATYSLKVTDSNECSATDSITVTQPAVVTITAVTANTSDTADVISCDGASVSVQITVSVSGGTKPYQYKLESGSYQWDSVFTDLSAGIYTIAVEDSNECSASVSHTVSTPSVITVSADDSSSALSISPGSFVYVAPYVTITVNNKFTLQQCEVLMGAGSAITVDPGDTLQILGSNIHACDTMWNGITVSAGGTIVLDEYGGTTNRVGDAVEAVEVSGNDGRTRAMFANTDFYKNQYSIVFYDYFPISDTAYNVSNCNFSMGSDTSLLPAPAGTTNYKRSVAGIVVEWSGPPLDLSLFFDTVSIPNPYLSGQPNTFKNMNTGIYAINSVLNVFTNTFDSIRNYEPVNTYGFYGAAIVGSPNFYGVTIINSLNVQTNNTVPDSLSTIRFSQCDYGIKVIGYILNAINNRMDNVTSCVQAANCYNQISVDSNYFTKTNFGVTLNSNSGAQQLVDGNTIYVNDPVFRAGRSLGRTITGEIINTYGVSLSAVNSLGSPQSFIQNNVIYNGRASIQLTNSSGVIISNDTIHQNSPTAVIGMRYGITASYCTKLQIADNLIDAIGSGYLSETPTLSAEYAKTGIYLSNTPTAKVFCNTLGGMDSLLGISYGLSFVASCDQAQIFDNTMNHNAYGMYLQPAGSSPVLPNQGANTADSAYGNDNVFNGNGDAAHTFSNANAYRTYTQTTNLHYLAPTFWYTGTDITSNTGVTDPSGATVHGATVLAKPVTDTLTERLCAINYHLLIHNHSSQFDTAIAMDSAFLLMEPGFETTGPWLANKILYEELRVDTGWLNSDSVMQRFYAQIDTTDIGAIAVYEDTLAQLNSSAVINDTTLYSVFDGESYVNYTMSQLVVQHAATALSAVPTGNVQSSNYVAVNYVYLNLLANVTTSFSTDQLYLLDSIAAQCPYVAGDAVYTARVLYSLADNSIFYNDQYTCGDSGRSERMLLLGSEPKPDTTTATLEFVQVYPNPAHDLVNLMFLAKTEGQVYFEMINQMGETIMEKLIPNGINFEQYSTEIIGSGVYQWRLRDSERTIKTGKIVIIK